jgi:hypothetical protein
MDIAANVFSDAMIGRAVSLKLASDFFGGAAFIGHDKCCGINMGLQNRPQCFGRHFGHMMGADAAFALN